MKLPEGLPRSALLSALFHGSILVFLVWPKEVPPPADAGMAGSVAVTFVTGSGTASASMPSASIMSASASKSADQPVAPQATQKEDRFPTPDPASKAVEEMAPLEMELAEPPPPPDESELTTAGLELDALPEPAPVKEALEAAAIVEKPLNEQQASQKPRPLPATKPTPPRETETAAKPASILPSPAETQLASLPPAAMTDAGPAATAMSDATAEPLSTSGSGTTSSGQPIAAGNASLETGANAGMPTGSGPLPGPSAADQEDYASLLAAWLDRHKEYPDRARRKHQEGIVLCEFAIDRQGQVLSYRIVQGSGYELLDEEASELMVRANPLPPPPVGMDQTYVVPIVFALN